MATTSPKRFKLVEKDNICIYDDDDDDNIQGNKKGCY
jgi:hypothetical protein